MAFSKFEYDGTVELALAAIQATANLSDVIEFLEPNVYSLKVQPEMNQETITDVALTLFDIHYALLVALSPFLGTNPIDLWAAIEEGQFGIRKIILTAKKGEK